MHQRAFITSAGKFLPGEPVSNDEMEARLGQVGSSPSRLRERVLNQNGIKQRYYAIDAKQQTVWSNSQMAARAVQDCVSRIGGELKDIPLLVAATSQGDLPLPGFASMVHGVLIVPMLLHSFGTWSLLTLPVFSITFNNISHSNYDFLPDADRDRWWLNAARRHHLHHACFHGNYGFMFPFMDRLFGTALGPDVAKIHLDRFAEKSQSESG